MNLYEKLKARIQGKREPAAKAEARKPETHEAKIQEVPESESPYDKLQRTEQQRWERFMRDEDEDEANPRSLVNAWRAKY